MKKLITLVLLIFCLQAYGQEKIKINEEDYRNYEVEMADKLREDGKIYVLVAIITIIMSGILFYTVTIDRKVSKLEKEITDDKDANK